MYSALNLYMVSLWHTVIARRRDTLDSSLSLTFCKKNLELYSQPVLDALQENYPDIKIEIKDCVDLCGTCTDIPFALRYGALVGGKDPLDLYRKLLKGRTFLDNPKLPGTAGCVEKEDAALVSLVDKK